MTDDYAKVIREEEAWVVECAGRLVGLLVRQAQPDHLLLENVAVSPDSQNLGIGRLLLDLADRRARELEFSEVRLYTNVAMTENLAYYPRHGYHETRRATQDRLSTRLLHQAAPRWLRSSTGRSVTGMVGERCGMRA